MYRESGAIAFLIPAAGAANCHHFSRRLFILTFSRTGLTLAHTYSNGASYKAASSSGMLTQMAERRSSALEQRVQWKDQRVLVIEDEALDAAINWEKADPEKLE